MERAELQAKNRTLQGKKVRQLRAQSWIPGVVYGPDTPPRSIQMRQRDLFRTLQNVGETALIDLLVDGENKPYVVLARDVQRDILTSRLQHVDFYQVRLTEKVKTTPRLDIVGESPAVKSGMAVLIQILNQVEVECLPTDLISAIEVDISNLKTLDDSISIGDLPVPDGVTILADPSDTVVSVVPPRTALEAEAKEVEPAVVLDEAEATDFVDEEAAAEE